LSGIDEALWDIKGKQAGMPVYELFGGQCRPAAEVYVHAWGADQEALDAAIERRLEQGFRHIRVQMGNLEAGYGGDAVQPRYDAGTAHPGNYFDPRKYSRDMLAMLKHVRERFGEAIELIHDVHERLRPVETIQFAKAVEPLNLYFLEDPLAPEDLNWFKELRAASATPIAMGELFSNPAEWRPLVESRQIDFLRLHVSQVGGITPARKIAHFAEFHGVRTAWHGPSDTSPVGHMAQLHLDVTSSNFGIQEWCEFPEAAYKIFPGLVKAEQGGIRPNSQPGWGIDIDEEAAADYPPRPVPTEWTQVRLPDGSPARP